MLTANTEHMLKAAVVNAWLEGESEVEIRAIVSREVRRLEAEDRDMIERERKARRYALSRSLAPPATGEAVGQWEK